MKSLQLLFEYHGGQADSSEAAMLVVKHGETKISPSMPCGMKVGVFESKQVHVECGSSFRPISFP